MRRRIAPLLAITVVVCFLLWNSRAPSLPACFDKSLTYAAALEQSRATGKPVFAYASADWCTPCREFKRVALRDPRITQWLSTRTIPVYLDVTSQASPGAAAAATLGVISIPAIFLIKDGQPVGRHEGTLDADALLNWLETFSRVPPIPTG